VQHTELAKFRRARSRWHIGLKPAEMVVENYAFQLAQIEARIQELAPDLNLPLRFYKLNPVFTRNELRPAPHRDLARGWRSIADTGHRHAGDGYEGRRLPPTGERSSKESSSARFYPLG
jgi:hypothetical protein